jgi:tetratricopeptide (TPR) repeat protein
MNRPLFWIFAALPTLGFYPASSASAGDVPLVRRQWFETRTAHFNIYSCGAPQEVNKVAGQLEEFCEAFALLAGSQAVASPPIVVMAFPDRETMKPFLPLYQGQPENLAGFFQHGNDENLIVLSLPTAGAASTDMTVVFHEYTHLLFRRNDRIWPIWLKEGMAEVYSTFATTGYSALIAQPIDHHLQLLAHEPLMPLTELFAVTHDSPQYNERERQGIFYAESWLLTQFLMAGDNPGYRSRFGNFTALLRDGQSPVQAFTSALQTTLPTMETELRRYLARGRFAPIKFNLPENVAAAKPFTTRNLTPVENYFRLGDELFRIDRLDDAEKFFTDAQKLAPASPLPCEGLGLLAVRRDQTGQALREFQEALQRGPSSFRAHYLYAWSKFRLAADAPGRRGSLPKETAADIHDELLKSIRLMPNFGPSHELFGILEVARGENLPLAVQHLQLAVALEPENPYYLLALADAQARTKDLEAAHRTLTALLLPTVEARLRAQAEELLQQITNANSTR